MAEKEAVRQEFEEKAAMFCLNHNVRTVNCTPRAEELIEMLWAAYLSGERAMREKAADFASHHMANELARRIRALPLSAPEEKLS